jgi:hypothetical protein
LREAASTAAAGSDARSTGSPGAAPVRIVVGCERRGIHNAIDVRAAVIVVMLKRFRVTVLVGQLNSYGSL